MGNLAILSTSKRMRCRMNISLLQWTDLQLWLQMLIVEFDALQAKLQVCSKTYVACVLMNLLDSAVSSISQESFLRHCFLLGKTFLYFVTSSAYKSKMHTTIIKSLGISLPLVRWFFFQPCIE